MKVMLVGVPLSVKPFGSTTHGCPVKLVSNRLSPPNVGVTYDRVPKGEVEIRRSSVVVSPDGHELGTVHSVEVDSGAIAHVAVERGHLWWKRVVPVPIESVTALETNAITLGLTRDDFSKLPKRKR